MDRHTFSTPTVQMCSHGARHIYFFLNTSRLLLLFSVSTLSVKGSSYFTVDGFCTICARKTNRIDETIIGNGLNKIAKRLFVGDFNIKRRIRFCSSGLAFERKSRNCSVTLDLDVWK